MSTTNPIGRGRPLGLIGPFVLLATLAVSSTVLANPFNPSMPELEVDTPSDTAAASDQQADPLKEQATFIGTVNGVSVYVESTSGCYLYREAGDWRDSTCLESARKWLRESSSGTS